MQCSEVIVQTNNDHNYTIQGNANSVPFSEKGNCSNTNSQDGSWQTVTNKSKRQSNSSHNINTKKPCTGNVPIRSNNIELQNQFDSLSDINEMDAENSEKPRRESKPPPIFIPSISNVPNMVKHIESIISKDDYMYKCLNDNKVKICTTTIDAYRKLVQSFTDSEIGFHTFQIKSERAYRAILKNMHFSNDVEDIKLAIEAYGHKVRNVSNMKSYKTKNPLPMFSVDLEPAPNNKDIFQIEYLLNAKIYFEAPYKRNEIVQCKKCQRYGHTKSYCQYPNRCVKCCETHDTASCKKLKNNPPKCVLCGGEHPANYKGCMIYQDLKNKSFPPLRNRLSNNQTYSHDNNEPEPTSETQKSSDMTDKRSTVRPTTSYASAASGSKDNESANANNATMEVFFAKIEKLMAEQAKQIGTLINLLSTVISKLK